MSIAEQLFLHWHTVLSRTGLGHFIQEDVDQFVIDARKRSVQFIVRKLSFNCNLLLKIIVFKFSDLSTLVIQDPDQTYGYSLIRIMRYDDHL